MSDTGQATGSTLWLRSEDIDEIREAIDAFAWKHSWHLPVNAHGDTDWSCDETLRKCRNVLNGYQKWSSEFAAKCERLAKEIARIEQNKADDAKANPE